MDATVRESALAHAEVCARCGARLAGERMLSSGLRAFAASLETMDAPAPVEAALRAVFRQRKVVAAGPVPVVALAPARARRWLPWATAAAAAIVTVLAIQVFRFRESPAPLRSAGNVVAVSNLSRLTREIPKEITAPVAPAGTMIASMTPRATSGSPGNQMMTARYAADRKKSSRAPSEATTSPAESEIMTDFMPLTYGAAMSPNEGGQLVRVELPRSALVSMGLPMNAELSNERVKADILLGYDGMARAIRFVR